MKNANITSEKNPKKIDMNGVETIESTIWWKGLRFVSESIKVLEAKMTNKVNISLLGMLLWCMLDGILN